VGHQSYCCLNKSAQNKLAQNTIQQVIQPYTVQLKFEATCTLDLGVYVCGIHRSVSWGTQAELVQGTITTLARRSKVSRTSERGTHVRKWLDVFPTPCTETVRARFIASPPLQYITSNSFDRASFPLKLICSFTLISIYIFI
jgi:hypothetical protein